MWKCCFRAHLFCRLTFYGASANAIVNTVVAASWNFDFYAYFCIRNYFV